jgi:ubiquinone/menaquinone biosynthesis C-methylase UbiE
MPRLAHVAELLDGPLDDPVALEGSLRDLARVNRFLGGAALSSRALESLAGRPADRGASITLIDIGTGGADIPLRLLREWQRLGRRLHVTGVDGREEVLDAARTVTPALRDNDDLTLEVADGRRLPWPDGSFDIAHCSLLLHHLDERNDVALLREMGRIASRGVIVNDLARGRGAWLGATLLAHVFTRNHYTRHDGPLSVRRAYSIQEARALLAVAGLRPVIEARGLIGHRWAIGAAIV